MQLLHVMHGIKGRRRTREIEKNSMGENILEHGYYRSLRYVFPHMEIGIDYIDLSGRWMSPTRVCHIGI